MALSKQVRFDLHNENTRGKIKLITDTTINIKLVAFIGDSWLAGHRFRSHLVSTYPRDYIDIRPHATKTVINTTGKIVATEGTYIEFFSFSSAKIDDCLDKTLFQSHWAIQVPEVTVLHVGACDIANSNKYTIENIKSDLSRDIMDLLTTWPEKARETLKTDNQKAEFDRKILYHKWLIVKIPNWSESGAINGMDPKVFKQLRKRANTGITNRKTRFWTQYRAALVAPDLEYPKFHPGQVHLNEEYQNLFNTQILNATSKLICDFCTWTRDTFEPSEHKNLNQRHECARNS